MRVIYQPDCIVAEYRLIDVFVLKKKCLKTALTSEQVFQDYLCQLMIYTPLALCSRRLQVHKQ